MLYSKEQNLFSKVIAVKTKKELYELFEVPISGYWLNHYQFDKKSPNKKKQLSASFIDLLVINTIVPIQFTYNKSLGKEVSESLLDLLREIAPEQNAVVNKFSGFGIKATNAFESQSLLQMKNEYCNQGKCLQCAVGIQLLKE
jgi:agmatine/peptidylarginine deiminase